jgi:hypothetical protein
MPITKPAFFRLFIGGLLFFSTTTRVLAQDSTQLYKHEVALDMVPLLNNTVLRSYSFFYNPYQVLYRYHSKNWAVRARLSVGLEQEVAVNFDTAANSIENKEIALSLGVEKKYSFNKALQLFYGLDLTSGYKEYIREEKESSRNIRTYDYKTNSYGVAPFLGFRYNLNSRISITTETSIFLFYNHNYYKSTRLPDNPSGTVSVRNEWTTEYIPPTSLYITFYF